MLQAIILYLSFFTSFVLLIYIIPSHKSNMGDGFGITIIKISSSRLTLLRFVLLRIKSLLKNESSESIRVYTTKDYIIIRKCMFIKVFNYLTRNKPIRSKCYCYQIRINSFITHFFLAWKVLWKQLFHTFLEPYIDQEENQMVLQKCKDWQLYCTFFKCYTNRDKC